MTLLMGTLRADTVRILYVLGTGIRKVTEKSDVLSQMSVAKIIAERPSLRAPQRSQSGNGAEETALRMRSTAVDTFSCSQTRMTLQPSADNFASVSASRVWLREIFHRHHSELRSGTVPCSGQPCQKQPSTWTTTFWRVKAMSTFRRGSPGTLY